MFNSVVFNSYFIIKQCRSVVQHENIFSKHVKLRKNFLHVSCAQNQVKSQPQNKMNVFDREAKKMQRERAALSQQPEIYDYLKDEIGYRLADRVLDIKKKFKTAIDLGCGRGYVSKHILSESVDELIMTDHSELLMSNCVCNDANVKTRKVVCDEEDIGSFFKPETADLVISNLVLHWVNELPSCFKQVMNILTIDGVFLGCVFGIDTLFELRSALQLAETERKGGISPHISPFMKPTDIGHLLVNAGFTMQTIDVDEIVVRYPTMFELMEDLKGMGESNAAWNRGAYLTRDVLLAASVIYENLYADTKKDAENYEGVPATFQIIYFIGWKPDKSKPQSEPKDPVMTSLREYYKIDEVATTKPEKFKIDE